MTDLGALAHGVSSLAFWISGSGLIAGVSQNAVERANRTHTDEFYQVTPCSLEMKKLNRELRHWENIYNTLRPHQSLGYLTPHQFLLQISSQRKE